MFKRMLFLLLSDFLFLISIIICAVVNFLLFRPYWFPLTVCCVLALIWFLPDFINKYHK